MNTIYCSFALNNINQHNAQNVKLSLENTLIKHLKKVNGNDGEEKYLQGDGNDGEESEQRRWTQITQWTWTQQQKKATTTMTVREGERTEDESNRSRE